MSAHLDLDIAEKAAEIVEAYVSYNALSASDLPALIQSVYSTIVDLRSSHQPMADASEDQLPAISIKKSITPEYLVCLEDGLKFKSLKRHLMTDFGMTPDQYRTKWKLPASYPMVAPNYSVRRSNLAKANGLGRKS